MDSVAGADKSSYNGIRVMLHNETDIISNKEMYDKCYKHITKTNVNQIIKKYFAEHKYYFSAIGGKVPKKSAIEPFITPVRI